MSEQHRIPLHTLLDLFQREIQLGGAHYDFTLDANQVSGALEQAFTRVSVLQGKGDSSRQLEIAVAAALQWISNKMSTAGKTMRNVLGKYAAGIIDITRTIDQAEENTDRQVVGRAWEIAQGLKSLPENNSIAVAHKLLEILVLCRDAKSELEQFKCRENDEEQEDDENQTVLSSSDFRFILPSGKLVHLGIAVIKRLYAFLIKTYPSILKEKSLQEDVQWLELAVELSDAISMHFDELVSSFYELPEDQQILLESAESLVNSLTRFISHVSLNPEFSSSRLLKSKDQELGHEWCERVYLELNLCRELLDRYQ
jgi:hypothetical protein